MIEANTICLLSLQCALNQDVGMFNETTVLE